MGLNNPQGGLGYAAEFQTSALPYVTSSQVPLASSGITRIDFAKVSRFITVVNLGSAGQHVRVGFTRNGMTNGNYVLVDGTKDITFDYRVTSVYLAGDAVANIRVSVAAGLTNIDARQMPVMTGTLSNGDPGWIGVG